MLNLLHDEWQAVPPRIHAVNNPCALVRSVQNDRRQSLFRRDPGMLKSGTLVARLRERAAGLQALSVQFQTALDEVGDQLKLVDQRLEGYNSNEELAENHPVRVSIARGASGPIASGRSGPATLPALILAVVSQTPLTAAEIFASIQQRFVVDVPKNHFYPTLWRMVRTGRLHKHNTRYARAPDARIADADAARPSALA